MMRGIVCGIAVGVILCSGAGAQGPGPLQLASREPAFYAIVGTHIERAEAGSFAALRARLVLRLHNATIPEALTAIEEQTKLRFAYKPSILPSDATVSLDAGDITVAAALTQILLDADVDVEIAPYGQATLVGRDRTTGTAQPNDTIVVRGSITDSSSHNPVAGVTVRVAGGKQVALSGADGTYTLSGLPPGTYRLLIRRLGYAFTSMVITAPSAGVYTRDITLVEVPTVLNQVVTTVTGSQQLKTIGNTIATINADSLVPTTPVTTLSDIINARAAGVQVINPGGLTGASPMVFVRGMGSLVQSSQPLLYVDGVRVTNSFATRPSYPGALSGGFNDLVPEDIESIEIVKGPSAATLYGTDAANGVILVTTKRGGAGATHWNIYSEGGALTVNPDFFPYNYTGWGQSAGQITNSCTLIAMASGSCTQDSVTKFTPLRVPSLTPLGTGNTAKVGVEVSGGVREVRYFVSGDYASEVGPLKDPVRDQHMLDSLLGAFAGSGNIRRPNAVSKYDGRVNLTTPFGSTADVTLTANYLSQASHIPNTSVTAYDAGGAGYRDACDGWPFCQRPAASFATIATDNTQHVTGGATAHWLPTRWLTARATVGVDASNDAFLEVLPAAAAPVSFTPGGSVYDMRQTTTLYSVDLGATARLPLTSFFVSSTSVGTQYHRVSVASTTASATQLTVGGTSVGAGIPTGVQVDTESIVAGAYAEEQLAFNDRLFLTGAVRVDGANDFGRDFQSAVYPKGSVSWLVSKEPFFPAWSWLSLWRLRSAYGESGTQPGEVLTTLQAKPATIDGISQPGLTLSTLGNAMIQPERQRELEIGSDIDLANNRLHIEFTYYRKRNENALYNTPLGSSLSLGSVEQNIGEIVNWGYEALVSTTLLAERSLTWDVSLNGSVNHNQIVSLGPYFQPQFGLFGNTSYVAGYAAPAWFAQPYTYSDANHDGILEPNEISVSSKFQYYGQAIPPQQVTLATHIGFFENHLRIGAQFDYRGGFVIPNTYLATQCYLGTAAADNLRSASLASQAACLAYNTGVGSVRGVLENGSFTRFRELSLTYVLPDRVARSLNSRSLSISLSARNVAVWTHFQGGDPESAPNFLGSVGSPPYGEGGGLPATQYWLARINVGL